MEMDETLEGENVVDREGNDDYSGEVPTKIHQESKNDRR
jgi:hypothetical protein